MTRYKIDGIEYEIADDVDLASTVEKIRALPSHKKPKKEEESYGKRILTEGIPGAAAGIGNLALDVLRSPGAGLIGLGTAIGTGSMERGMEEFENAMESSKSVVPAIPDKTDGALMGILEKGMGYLGDVGELATQGGGAFNLAARPEDTGPGGRTVAEALSNFAPIPGMRAASKLPHVGSEWKARQAEKAKALEVIKEKIAAEAAAKKNYETAEMPADLFPDKDPRAAQPGLRSPYMIPEAERLRIEEEMRQTEAEAGRRGQSQGDLFETPMENLERRASEGQTGARDKPEPMDFPATDRPDTPGVAPLLQEQGVLEGTYPRVDEGPTTIPLTRPDIEVRKDGSPKVVEKPVDPSTVRYGKEEPTPVGSIGVESPGFNQALVNRQLGVRNAEDLRTLQESGRSRPPESVRTQLDVIRTKSQIPYYRELADYLLKDKTFNPRFDLVNEIPDSRGAYWEGVYHPSKYKIELLKSMAGNEALLLHEAIHARTHTALELGRRLFNNNTPHLKAAVERVYDLYESFKKEGAKTDRWRSIEASYGITSVHEFMAEGFTNPQFQSLLARTPVPKNLASKGFRHYWDAFVDRVGKLLGFDKSKHNYLSELIKAGADIMEGADSNVRMAYENQHFAPSNLDASGKSVGGYSLDSFKSDLKDKGIKLPDAVVKKMYEEQTKTVVPETKDQPAKTVLRGIKGLKDLRRELMDDRPLAELAEEISAHKDITFAQANTLSKIGNPDYMAKDHPTIAWSISQINRIKNSRNQEIHDLLFGDTGSKKAPAPGSFYHKWSELNLKERTAVNDVGQALNNSHEKLSLDAIQAKAVELNKRPLSDAQLQAYHDRIAINSAILKKINAGLAKEGKEPIAELPHYWSPAEFDGKFIVTITDPTTGAKIVRGSYLRPNVEKLQKEFPGMQISEPLERGRRAAFDMDQYIIILRHLNKEMRDPATKALAEGWRRSNYIGSRGMKREGAKGAMGTEGGRKGLDRYEEVSEKYIRQAHEYLGNREIDGVYNELLEFEPAKRQPNSHAYALESLDQARGGMNATMQALSDGVGLAVRSLVQMGSFGKVVPPTSIIRDVMRPANQAKSALLLGFFNPAFMAQNLLQSTFAAPKMLGLGAEYGGKGLLGSPAAVMKATTRALTSLMDPKNSDVAKLDRIGAFDASLKYDWESYSSDLTKLRATVKDHMTGMSTNLAIESHAVRKPAALMFLEMLREIGYDKIAKTPDEIYWMTKNLTEDYMVAMNRHKKPHALGRSGTVGTVMGPLQSFATTWLAQLREYTKLAGKSHQNLANALPLASFMAVSMLTAGLVNLIASKEYDAVVGLLNSTFNMKLPLYEELVLTYVKSDYARFGVLAGITGLNVGALFAPPTVTGSFAPGAQFLVDVGDVMIKALRETGALGEMNKLKESEKRDALKAILPRSTWGWVEDAYTPEGAPTQTKKGTAGPYTRTEKDKLARKFSTYTLEEQKGKMLQYPAEQKMLQRRERLKTSTSLMVDALITGENPTERIATLVQDLSEDNYSAKEIREALKEQLKAKYTEKDIRMMGKGKTTRQQLLIQYWNHLK